MELLVSVLIPCYNAERWVAAAVESALAQDGPEKEIIVVDDGSTDASLDVIRSFGHRVRWETGPNRGGNRARNRLLELSRGQWIQYLDADDYLLPEKFKEQVRFLEETGADAVYGDWCSRFHLPDGTDFMSDTYQVGDRCDILESLLEGWWVPPHAYLHRAQSIKSTSGWDESLPAAQDLDFTINLALQERTPLYQSGCRVVYRRYGNVTVSTSSPSRLLDCSVRILQKVEAFLTQHETFSPKYWKALAGFYFQIARRYFGLDRQRYIGLIKKAQTLSPDFRSRQTRVYNWTSSLFGFTLADCLAEWKRSLLPRHAKCSLSMKGWKLSMWI
jgi:glycosyltransferase involved in cell wall biosynthesis